MRIGGTDRSSAFAVFAVDHELELACLLYWEISGLSALENLPV
jgi:hypothetical protein